MVDTSSLLSFSQVFLLNLMFICLIFAVIVFIFIRSAVIMPFQYWLETREKVYDRVLSVILKYPDKLPRMANSKFLRSENFMDRSAIENILIKKIEETDDEKRREILCGLYEKFGLLEFRIKQLGSISSWKRKIAADMLGRSLSKKAIGPLSKSLWRDKDLDVKFIAAKSLSQLEARQAIEYIIGLLDKLPYRRCAVIADMLIFFGDSALPHLISRLGSRNAKTEFWCVRSLAEIDIKKDHKLFGEMKEKLLSMLSDGNFETRGYSAICLSRMKAVEATPDIIRILKDDPEPAARYYAATALGIMEDPSAMESLARAMDDKSWQTSQSAGRALAKFGSQIEPILSDDPGGAISKAWERCKELTEEFGINDLPI